ncbi:MAG: ParB/RepB/Spo0J family partition protein [Desulfobacteraceae bacterium]
MEIELCQIYPNPAQPRKVFAEEPLNELAQSIIEQGLIEPLVVVERPGPLGQFMIVAGERRWRASQLAGLATVPVRVIEANDAEIAEMALVENIQRQDLTPLEEAKAFQALLESGYTKEQLAQKMGFKQPWRIDEALTLLDLSPKLQDALAYGVLSPFQASWIGKLKNFGEQEIVFNKIKAGDFPTANHLRRFVTAMIETKKQSALFAAPKREELEIVNRWEKVLASVAGLIMKSFNKDDCRVLAKVWQGNTAKTMQEIDLIVTHLNLIKKAILDNASRQEAAQIQKSFAA